MGSLQSGYTEDARLLPPDFPMITGRSAIREALREFIGAGMGDLIVESYDIEVHRSGGSRLRDRDVLSRAARIEPGQFVEIYRQQPDGTWKCAVDMFCSD